ncbi:MAG: GAF domain-containing protein [candidate division Zixibacteria bacterium]|nr:GAF domain-containing protein [candidate division Zixibacteria bacterium]
MMSSHEKIFIIDDEQRMCDSLTALLSGEGYQVAAFQSSSDAIAALGRDRVDLVITDIKMAGPDGLEILRVVKEIDPAIPVILMTGFGSLDTALEAIEKGAYDYLLKPVEFAYLELAVRRALEKRRSELAEARLMEELKISNIILKRRIDELDALYEAGKSIGSSANLDELLRQIVVLAATVTEAQVGSIMLLDERRQYLKVAAEIGHESDDVTNVRLPIGESIAGYVAKTGEALVIRDVEQDDRFKRINKEKYGAASLLSVPLRIKNMVLGVINMANKSGGGPFTDDDLRLLATFASQAAVAVDDASQFEKNRRRLAEVELLNEMATQMHTIESVGRFRDTLVQKLRRIFPIDYAIWFTWNREAGSLTPEGATGQADIPLTESGRIDLARVRPDSIRIEGLDLAAMNLGDIRALSDAISERIAGNQLYPRPDRAFMAVPIFRGGELAHILYMGSAAEQGYSDEDIDLAKLVISQSAVLFEREKAVINATRLMTMGNMISEISHDLRRPLNSIRGTMSILWQRHPELLEEMPMLKGLEDEVHRMNELVRELVDFSNPNRYETSRLDLRGAVLRAAELVTPDLKKKQIELKTEFAAAPWEIIANKNQLIEMFLNLLLNAMDAMPKGGTLTIKGVIERPEHKEADYLAIKVIDTGHGIKTEHLSRVFDRYFTTKDTGTGLGLAVVDRIASAHHGLVRVESMAGNGACFSIFFPIATAE